MWRAGGRRRWWNGGRRRCAGRRCARSPACTDRLRPWSSRRVCGTRWLCARRCRRRRGWGGSGGRSRRGRGGGGGGLDEVEVVEVAVDLVGGGVDNGGLGAVEADGFEDVDRAEDVDLEVL